MSQLLFRLPQIQNSLVRTAVKAPTSCLPSYALSTGSESMNASNTSSSFLPTKFLPPYLHKLISVQCPRRLSSGSLFVVTLARKPALPSLKILIAPFGVLHHVSGINSLYLFVNLTLVPVPPFPTHLFLHPSSSLPVLFHHSAHP